MRFAQEVKPASWLDDSFWMLSDYMVLSLCNFHEHSEFTSIFTSTLTSETSVNLQFVNL